MKNNKYILLGLSCLTAFASCKDDVAFVPEYELPLQIDAEMTASVNAANTHQTIDGFGSSDAWMMDPVGKYWSDKNKEGIAKLLFSRERDENNRPQGIGLSMWRFNVGTGSAEQGSESGISNESKRTECFLTSENGSYDWNKQSGQQYFMQKAKEYGCESFILFSNSAPVYFTGNKLAGGNENLPEGNYEKFGDFLATVAEHFIGEGYNISYISPINEPEYYWGINGDDNQEGCRFTNEGIKKVAVALDASLTEKNLNTMMLLPEAAKWIYFYEYGDQGANRGNKIDELYTLGGSHYIGDLEHFPNIICGHSYYSDKTWDYMESTRTKLYEKASAQGLRIYQSEWSMLHNNGETMYEDYENFDKASYMDLALSMAKVLHHDLVTASMSSWCYWTSISTEVYSQKSRFYLIRVIPAGGDYGDIKEDGTFSASRNLWVLGNYSLFVKPGYQRVDLDIPEGGRELFGSAYISPEKDKVVVVYTNMTDQFIKIDTGLQGIDKQVDSLEQYTTSATMSLEPAENYRKGVLSPKSVTTLVYTLK